MQPTASFSTGRQLALLMQRNFPDRDWMFDLAQRAGESRDKVEWHLQEDMAPPRHIGEAATALLAGGGIAGQ
jgi:hypothetical protein